MKVSELIEVLKDMHPDMEVMYDVTQNGATMFKFSAILEIDEVTTSENENIVLLHTGMTDESFSLN